MYLLLVHINDSMGDNGNGSRAPVQSGSDKVHTDAEPGVPIPMKAQIITIGDEICRGEITDTNSAWLAGNLWDHNVTVARMTTCPDITTDIVQAIASAAKTADIIITTGGLGPTCDDLTVDAVCSLLDTKPTVHEASHKQWEQKRKLSNTPLSKLHTRQLRYPESSEALLNPVGLAPGFHSIIGSSHCYCLPGVPREMKALFVESVIPRVLKQKETMGIPSLSLHKETWRVFGIGESRLAETIAHLGAVPSGVSLHYQVAFPEIIVKLVSAANSMSEAQDQVRAYSTNIQQLLGPKVCGDTTNRLPQTLAAMCKNKSLTIAIAESCTAGLLGSLLTQEPGATDFFVGGCIVYANAEKVRQLGVSKQTIEQYGAVSEPCVREMAQGIRDVTKASIGVAITGIAGPGGGTQAKPVGTVWVGVCFPGTIDTPDTIKTKHFVWPGSRDQIRTLAAWWAMAITLRMVQDCP